MGHCNTVVNSVLYFSVFLVLSYSPFIYSAGSQAGHGAIHQNRIENLVVLPLVRQSNDYTCGAAAALSILACYGDTPLEIEIAKELGTNSGYGTDFRQMTRFFKSKGYQVIAHEGMTVEELQKFICQGIPVVCLIQAWEEDVMDYSQHWSIGHFVVAVGYDQERIYFMDPWILGNYGYLPKQEFENRWHQLTYDHIRLKHWGMAVFKETKRTYDPGAVLYIH